MSLVPDPVPLDPPAGSPDAVDDAARATVAAARLLDELTDRLTGARATAWRGADADAAEARRGRIARMSGDGADVLYRIALRLAGHADVLREVQARIAVLQAAQGDEFAFARDRVAVTHDPTDPLAPDPADVLARLAAAEAERAAEHVRLTARVDDDAADTVRVFSGAAELAAGSPRFDSDAALLRLASLLPAWGTPEVARRGYLLARAVRDDEEFSTDELIAAARADADLAADPAYAAAFLAGLRPHLVTGWLATAWGGAPADDPRTDLMARVLSALDRDSSGPPWLTGLLDGARGAGELPSVAGGLGAVLARAKATGLAGPPPALAAAWTRSLAQEERATGYPTDLGVAPAGADPYASDPLALLAEAMVEQRAALEVARAMSDRDAWTVVLSRTWNEPALRDALITTVADAPSEAARPALRNGLVALGTGLEDGDPHDWPFVEDRIKEAAPVLATALLRHPDVVVDPLAGVAAGSVDTVSVTALRGLAVTVALDAGPVAGTGGRVGEQIAQALSRPRPGFLPADGSVPDVAVPAAFVAVREHGTRLAHTMEQHRRRDEAEAKAQIWEWTFGIGFTLAGAHPTWGRVAAPVEVLVTDALDTDGSWTNTPDLREHHPATNALAGAVTGLEPGSPERGGAAREALLAYAKTLQVLGTPVPPVAPDDSLGEKLVAAVVGDAVDGAVGRRLRVQEGLDGIVGGALVDAGQELVGGSD